MQKCGNLRWVVIYNMLFAVLDLNEYLSWKMWYLMSPACTFYHVSPFFSFRFLKLSCYILFLLNFHSILCLSLPGHLLHNRNIDLFVFFLYIVSQVPTMVDDRMNRIFSQWILLMNIQMRYQSSNLCWSIAGAWREVFGIKVVY
jgi:hypothetical protein